MRSVPKATSTRPHLSIIVAIYNMAREAPRTLFSLSRDYQRDLEGWNYEVLVVDNGSDEPFGDELVREFGENFGYHYIADASPSPAAAMNAGADMASGEWLCLMIDGARLVTPGLVASALTVLAEQEASVVETMAFHLGPDRDVPGARDGFDRASEDELLASIGWPQDPYRLFDVSSLAGSSKHGWYGPINECNCLFVRRSVFDEVGGFDDRFDEPGGGFVNLDFYDRIIGCVDQRFRLVGEASFHQMHDGASTSLGGVRQRLMARRWNRQYRRIRGRRFRSPPEKTLVLRGESGPQAQRWMEASRELWPPS